MSEIISDTNWDLVMDAEVRRQIQKLIDERTETLQSQLTTAHEKIGVMREILKQAEQFCTWLCEDSKKYPGTDAGIAARSQRHFIRAALEKVDK